MNSTQLRKFKVGLMSKKWSRQNGTATFEEVTLTSFGSARTQVALIRSPQSWAENFFRTYKVVLRQTRKPGIQANVCWLVRHYASFNSGKLSAWPTKRYGRQHSSWLCCRRVCPHWWTSWRLVSYRWRRGSCIKYAKRAKSSELWLS